MVPRPAVGCLDLHGLTAAVGKPLVGYVQLGFKPVLETANLVKSSS